MLRVKRRLFDLLNPKGPSLLRVYIRGCLGSNGPYFLAKAICKSKAPMKACFPAWAASKRKIPTEVMFKRRNFNLGSRCACALKRKIRLTSSLSSVNGSSLWSLALFLMGLVGFNLLMLKMFW